MPDSGSWRPWAKVVWPLLSREAVPHRSPIRLHAPVVTETVVPLVLTEIPEAATAAPAAGARGSAAATRVTPGRRSGWSVRMGELPSGGTVGGASVAPPRIGERPCCLSGSQRGPGPARTPGASAQVTRAGPASHRGAPVITVRWAEKPPQVPSGSLARIRTRWVTPASSPA
ncbi:hypothetical protein GCM10010129_60140 [Streptomyces fumigatiscleroticus]|nr:hypothetical protein GCM10010129_60140 [Streptomyces fumigatiscleroticus]